MKKLINIEDIRAMIAIRYPLFIHFLVESPFVADESIKTLSTDGKVIKFNPQFLADKTPEEQFFMFLHELGHNFLGHPLRFHDDWDNDKQQVAMDVAINSMLHLSGLHLPSGAHFKFEWKDMAFEEIYAAMEKNEDQGRKSNPKHNEEEEGEVEESPDMKDGEEESEDQLQGSQKQSKREELLEKHEQKQQEAVQSAKMMGFMTPELTAFLDKLLKPEINWKDAFAEYMTVTTGKDDYTYRYPNKKSDEVILPSLYSERGPIVAFIGDSSGSVSMQRIKEMASEVVGLMEDVQPEELHVLWCDTRVHNPRMFEEGEEVELEPAGRGGTDFRPAFKYLEDNGIVPDVAVYMTDGFCSLFPPAPSFPVMWMIWQDYRKFDPPFGEVIVFKGGK